MLKIYCNEECVNPNIKARIIIRNNQMRAEVSHRDHEETEDFIQETHEIKITPYNNYQLNKRSGGDFHIRRNHKAYRQSIKFYPIQRFALASRSDYIDFHDILQGYVLLQVDTGIFTDTIKNMAIKVIAIPRENLEIDSDIPWEIADYNQENQINPRFTLWDRYAIMIDGVEYQADHHGELLNTKNNIIVLNDREYTEIEIVKYSNGYQEKLERIDDCEEILIDCSAGLINAQRVYLENGKAMFRLYPFGYMGKFKLKLGWRWYPTWCEYNLVMR